MSYYKDQLIDFLKFKDFKSKNVLGVGCQEDDRKYFRSFKADKYLTMDNNIGFNPDIFCGVEDFDFEKRCKKYKRYFNDIFTFELWEYLSEPITALRNLHYLLVKGGRLWISAPFVYPHHNPEFEDMLRYTEWFWSRNLPKERYKIIEMKRRVWQNADGYLESIGDDYMKPAKEFNHNITGNIIIAEKI